MSITLKSLIDYANKCYNEPQYTNAVVKTHDESNSMLFNYCLIGLKIILKNNHNIYNEMVLINPIKKNDVYFQLINCYLLITDTIYITRTKIDKLHTIQKFHETLKYTELNTNNYNEFFKTHNYNLIICNDYDNYEIFNNNFDKYILIVKYDEEFLPLYNINEKHYTKKSLFVKHILNTKNFEKKEDLKNIKHVDNNKTIINMNDIKKNMNDIKENMNDIKENMNDIKENINDNDNNNNIDDNIEDIIEYNDLQTNDDYKLELSEYENKKENYTIITDNIFIPLSKNNESEINIDETLTKEDKIKLIKNTKKTFTLETLQKIALKLNIPIISGLLKNGKPKQKTKNDLYETIHNLIIY